MSFRRLAAVALAAATSGTGGAQEPSAPLPDTVARTYVRDLASRNALPSGTVRHAVPDGVSVLDEVVIYGQVDPEDFVRRRSRFLAFRDRLQAERPATPKEQTQRLLCLIGLCGIYGPDGLPVEPTVAERSESRRMATSTQLNAMFRGTLQ